MMKVITKFIQAKLMINHCFIYLLLTGCLGSLIIFIISDYTPLTSSFSPLFHANYRRRSECTCSRPELYPLLSSSILERNANRSSLCSEYATRRGSHQRVIAISLFGPKEVRKFEIRQSLNYLHLLIQDVNRIYSDRFILRIYHDDSINATNVICPIECKHPNVDFCDMNHKLYIPPKIWRFIPAGDPLVDVMISRDLDSALTERERAAVDVWLASNKSFHVMRDHPMHGTPMLGGMWGFRPSRSPNISRAIHNKIHNRSLVKNYGGRADQRFLAAHIWSLAKTSLIAHASFLCQYEFGHKTEPYPTQRRPANETNCFVGCARSCCGHAKMPFGECPKRCRPKDHPEWIYC